MWVLPTTINIMCYMGSEIAINITMPFGHCALMMHITILWVQEV